MGDLLAIASFVSKLRLLCQSKQSFANNNFDFPIREDCKLELFMTSYDLFLFWLSFLFKWDINLCSLFNAKAVFVDELQWYYLTHGLRDKWVDTFPKSICSKMSSWWEFRLSYQDATVQCFSHNTIGTPPK